MKVFGLSFVPNVTHCLGLKQHNISEGGSPSVPR
jgi:hypothetical protein